MVVKAFDWNILMKEVANKLPPMQYRAWLESAQFLKITETHLVFAVPTDFSRNWILDHYTDTFKDALDSQFGLTLDLRVELQGELLAEPIENNGLLTDTNMDDADISKSAPVSTTRTTRTNDTKDQKHEMPSAQQDTPYGTNSTDNQFKKFQQPQAAFNSVSPSKKLQGHSSSDHVAAISVRDLKTPVVKTLGQPLNPKYTFDSYVVGASNQFAAAAARAVAEQPASQYNPLFIYSSAGLGKTHLLNAIGNYLLRINPKIRICYLSAEAFVNELIESLRHERMSQFRQKFRDSYEILLMDDVQFLAGKDRSQEEFFHTFNALHSSRRQLVVTSDKSPKDIPGLEERIRTRFEWGLIADIQPPEIETRIAILRAKAELDDIFLPQDVALFLASNVKSNVRELEGALIKLGAQASLSGVEISLDLAKNVLKNLIKEPSQGVAADTILDVVSKHFSIRISDLKSKERSRRVAMPRQITMYLLRKYCEKSYPDIGILLGGKDHSTILHGVRTITNDLDRKPELRRHIEEIQNRL